ncbi:MAG: NAD(+) synthase [Oscillospiraceae bacterium]|nr:NAD(+) synthase [Oscillospiraceae bacterium]
MKHGFIKVAAGSVRTVVADPAANAAEIIARIREADEAGVHLLVLPELAVTGCTCGDLFYSDMLTEAAMQALSGICDATEGLLPLVIVGVPVRHRGKLYNCAAAIQNGRLLALIPKTHLQNGGDSYELRQFTSGEAIEDAAIRFRGEAVPFGTNLLLQHEALPEFCVGIEIGAESWAACPPAEFLTACGATVIASPSASAETVGKAEFRRLMAKSASARLLCGYVISNAGPEESTQDAVWSSHHLIAENGLLLAENPPFGETALLISEIDAQLLSGARHRDTAFTLCDEEACTVIPFSQPMGETKLTRSIEKNPFVLSDDREMDGRCETILQIQAHGLKKRMEHTRSKTAVVGISGGLDSCLALLVMVRAFDLMKKPREEILAVTMPGFGTTSRTKGNAEKMCELLGVTLRCVPIGESVLQHFRDIGHDPEKRDVTYENAQARERTQVLMDIANEENGLVVGTGDLSELALGWATYNGDHMSMYGVNGSVPKTLVRRLTRYEADHAEAALSAVLTDILDTPVSPELLPADAQGKIAQKTEDLVGPYELHDFFLYYLLRCGFKPSKIYRLARYAFGGEYTDDVILHWLRTFVRRFFIQQFKRSCIPDGPKVGSAAMSPRGDWRMPTDAVSRAWLQDLDALS